ncbi:serine/threonine-protein kinase RIO3 [Petromyzon marinus]|uniref:Serine/threonine-protein kinase RIO3 n=1 Tax=Petromyzon marinus TaxID=7757 RepID=A0AAJ7T3E0_PETMA|nr:serine/threonine-protein kinase RIO3 [Petromyzon marinus]
MEGSGGEALVAAVASTAAPKSPWGKVGVGAAAPCSLADVMSEELAQELSRADTGTQDEALSLEFLAVEGAVPGPVGDTESDVLLAKLLQMEFDREHDALLRREQDKLNRDSKVSISFENYRMSHPYEDSDSSEEEVDWQDTQHDPYRAAKPQPFPRCGFTGRGKSMTTKHDEALCGRKNTARMEHFPPEFCSGDGIQMDLKLSNQVFNVLKQHSQAEQRRSARLHEKKEHSTSDQAMDARTRLLLYKMVNAGVLESISGCISTGKESVVFHAAGGRMENKEVPSECAVKVFKTTLNEFKNRDKYIKDDYRFKDRFSKLNPRKVIRMWAEKEMHNLARMRAVGIRCPEVVLLKKHVLVMSFLGEGQVPAPKLKEARLSSAQLSLAYEQVVQMMLTLFHGCNLVHADLSEYNLLWHRGEVWLIDVSQSVEPTHPHGLEFLYRDCRNVSQFFRKAGVPEALDEQDLFNLVSGLSIAAKGEAEFLAEVEQQEKMHEGHAHGLRRKGVAVNPAAVASLAQ